MAAIEEAIRVALPDNQAVFLHPLQVVGGRRFFKVCKGDHKIARLLVGSFVCTERGLTGTTILEDLISMRNQKRQELLDAKETGNQREGLGIDSAPAQKRRKLSHFELPEVIQLDTPRVGPVQGIRMHVILGKSGTSLSIEATEANINYLRSVVAEQLSTASVDDGAEGMAEQQSGTAAQPSELAPIPSAGPGITWVKSRQAYRVRYKEDGQTRWKDFRSASLEAHDLYEASHRAAAFHRES